MATVLRDKRKFPLSAAAIHDKLKLCVFCHLVAVRSHYNNRTHVCSCVLVAVKLFTYSLKYIF